MSLRDLISRMRKHEMRQEIKIVGARQAVISQYNIENGIIRSPGKFEGEAVYVPYFYESWLLGGADRETTHFGRSVAGFDLGEEEKVEFPELRGRRTVNLLQRDDGFVVELSRFPG